MDVDPLNGSLRELSGPLGPPSGVFGELDGIDIVFFRSGTRLFVCVGAQLIDADDLAVVVHWRQVGRRHAEFAVARAGFDICRVRYRRRPPELDPGRWIRDVLDTPAQRSRIFASVGAAR